MTGLNFSSAKLSYGAVRRFFIILAVGIFSLLAPISLLAEEGRIPIYQATTITQPGHYILTRDLFITSGSAITINAVNVTLDLNERLISSSVFTNYLINILSGSNNITIKNGSLHNGAYGIYYYSANSIIRIYLHNLKIRYSATAGIVVDKPQYAEITGCEVVSSGSSGISLNGGTGTFNAKLTDNHLREIGLYGINLFGIQGGIVKNNIVTIFGTAAAGAGIIINGDAQSDAGGNTVEGNVVHSGGSDDSGIHIGVNSLNNFVLYNNTRNANHGLFIESSGNFVSHNNASSNSTDGIRVSGLRNIIENNMCDLNTGYGIRFNIGGTNAYRNNMLRGNFAGAVGGIANTDAGGNIVP